MNPIHTHASARTQTHTTHISIGTQLFKFQLIFKTKTYLMQPELFSVISLSMAEPQQFPLLSEMNRNAIDL